MRIVRSIDAYRRECQENKARLKGCLVGTLVVLLGLAAIAVGVFTFVEVKDARDRRWREVNGGPLFAEIDERFGCALPKTVSHVKAVERRIGGWTRRIVRFETSLDDFNAFLASIAKGKGIGIPYLLDSSGFPLLEDDDKDNAPEWLLAANASEMQMAYLYGASERMDIYADKKPDGRMVVYVRTYCRQH